jgi:hypothetical protein
MNFSKNEWTDQNQQVLLCPICQFEYTHLVGIETSQSSEPGVKLNFECEEGHKFSYRLYNHKGYEISELTKE